MASLQTTENVCRNIATVNNCGSFAGPWGLLCDPQAWAERRANDSAVEKIAIVGQPMVSIERSQSQFFDEVPGDAACCRPRREDT